MRVFAFLEMLMSSLSRGTPRVTFSGHTSIVEGVQGHLGSGSPRTVYRAPTISPDGPGDDGEKEELLSEEQPPAYPTLLPP